MSQSAEGVPRVAPDEHARGPDSQDVAYLVVLALVDLPRLEPGLAET